MKLNANSTRNMCFAMNTNALIILSSRFVFGPLDVAGPRIFSDGF